MTDLLETPAAFAQFAQMQADQDRFDATRPPCASWCGTDCDTTGHMGDAIFHTSPEVTIPATPDQVSAKDASVWVRAWRYDGLNEPSSCGIELDLAAAKSILPDRANFTAAQARQLAAELLRQADLVEPEYQVPVQQVQIGDWIQVEGQWMEVYCVLADEAANNVQISVSADPGNWSDFDYRDENPEHFNLADTVQVRRTAPAGGIR